MHYLQCIGEGLGLAMYEWTTYKQACVQLLG